MKEISKTINLTHEQLIRYQAAASAWELGDWNFLADIEVGFFINSCVYGEILACQAVAYVQLGDVEKGVLLAKKSNEHISDRQRLFSIVCSGIHNSFGRAHLLLNQLCKAHNQFSLALAYSTPYYRHSVMVDNRISTQQIALDAHKQVVSKSTKPFLSKKNKIMLGDGWAGNTINTVIFRHHGIMTAGEFQFTAFYQDHETIVFIKRDLETDEIERFTLNGEYNLDDAHNSISLGVDRSGYIHVSYDHHGTKLKYRRGEKPWSISDWSDELPMSGANEQKVTYPTFIIPKNGSPLLMLYRDGNWKKGSAYLKRYEESTLSWEDYPLPILSGAENKPWTSNAYWNNPVLDNNSCLHLSYVWRTDYFSDQQLVNNVNIGYAKSYDFGKSWLTIENQPYKLPITQVNSDVVWPITPGSNLINQCSMVIDSLGYPHIAFYANDETGIPQYQHVWYDGSRWNCSLLPLNKNAFLLSGRGTLQLPLSRPVLLLDKKDKAYMVFRSLFSKNKLRTVITSPPCYAYYEKDTFDLSEIEVGHSEPVIDHERWERLNILSFYQQKNAQPNGDVGILEEYSPVCIVEYAIC